MKRFKVLLGALVCMCMAFLITPVAQAADAPQNGWVLEGDSYYYYEDGMMVTSCLIEDSNGYTYYVGEDGRMVTDTLEWVDGGERYFNESGAMVTSAWEQITTYYEDDYEEWSWTDWYYFGSDGIAYTGVQTVNGVEYFFYGGGTLADSATVTYDETHIVKVNDAGVVIDKAEIQYNNWTYMGGEWYWFDDVYEPAQGIREIYGYTYYFDDGQMIKDRIVYTEMGRRAFDADGHMVENSWFLPTNHYERRWYYFGEEGVAGEGWFLYGSDWYYLENGAARVGDYVMDYYGQDIYYAFDTDGRMILACAYGDEQFSDEIGRLKALSKTIEYDEEQYTNNVLYDEESYNYPAYITIDGFGNTYEYALIDQSNNRVVYIYLAYPDDNVLKEYSEYVKKDMSVYKEESTWDAFSMYNHSFDGGESWVEFNNEVTMIATGDGTEDE